MDDEFLHQLRRDPPPEFQHALRERLHAQPQPRVAWRAYTPAFAAAAATVLAVALFTLPSVRASAQALLDLFRVRTFAAVEFDEARMEKLEALEKDNALMVFDRQEKLRDPGPRQYFPTADAAGAAAGLPGILKPSYLPTGMTPDSVFVEGAGHARMSVSEAKLRDVLRRLDLQDVTVPSGIDGQWVEVKKPAVVIQRFKSQRNEAGLVQGTSPEMSVPAGMDVARLAEIGLRVLGLDAGEARRIAQVTDWRSTMIVPVPMNASTFRQVTIHGRQGLLITTSGGKKGRRSGAVVLWTEGDRVLGLMTTLHSTEAVQIAESVR
jgi:hypothetical protein